MIERLKAWHWLAVVLVPGALGGAWWVASGGLAPFARSMEALTSAAVAESLGSLTDPEIAEGLRTLPAQARDVDRIEADVIANARRLEEATEERAEILEGLRGVAQSLEDVSSDLDRLRATMRADDVQVVVWAEAKTLELNRGLTCREGQRCGLWLRGKRTPEGLDCLTLDATFYVMRWGASEGVPARAAPDWEPIQLTLVYKTFWVEFVMPEGIVPTGADAASREFMSLTVYGDCGFAAPGDVTERNSMRVPVAVLPAR